MKENKEENYIDWIEKECFLSTPEQIATWLTDLAKPRKRGEFFRTALMAIEQQRKAKADKVLNEVAIKEFNKNNDDICNKDGLAAIVRGEK